LVTIDRETPLLLPPSIQEWVAEDDMARFIVEAVEVVEDHQCHFNWRGSGDEQYPPRMMLALLIYCYAHGIFSSRKIEQATYRDVAVRFITGDTHPDHDTIAGFRRDNGELFRATFVRVLEVARQLKVLRVGAVALDGTIMLANAAKRRGLKAGEIPQQLEELERVVGELERQAEAIDQREAAANHSEGLPARLAKAKERRQALKKAMEHLEGRSQRRAEEREKEWAERDPQSPGTPPQHVEREPRAQESYNPTDPEARVLRKKGGGYAPAYNVQVAVVARSEAPLIVASGVCDEANDRRQLEGMVEKTMSAAPETASVVVDSGYDNSAQIYKVERKHGVIVYCPPEERKEPKAQRRQCQRRRRTREFREGMRACVRSETGRANLRLRSVSVEPVIGFIKRVLGFTRFRLRGLAKVSLEWELVCLSFNFRLLHRLRQRAACARA
jgi:transposase